MVLSEQSSSRGSGTDSVLRILREVSENSRENVTKNKIISCYYIDRIEESFIRSYFLQGSCFLMEEKRYIISEVAEKTGIETHVLRYWEDELGLDISRNEMGHRYYTESQIQLFKQIKELKDSGFQLKAVKAVLDGGFKAQMVTQTENSDVQDVQGEAHMETAGTSELAGQSQDEFAMKRSEDKLAQFEQIIGDIVTRSLMANNGKLGESISVIVTERVSDKVIKEMDYMMRVREEAEDDRFRRLDETIRGVQKSNKEAAVFRERGAKAKKHHGIFKRKV